MLNHRTIKCNNWIPKYDSLILNNLILPYPFNIVIAPEATIGKNCTIYNGVTVGTDYKEHSFNPQYYPIIGDNVTIGSNSCVIGGVKVGNNVTVGHGVVVVKDIPDNCLVTGNPITITPK